MPRERTYVKRDQPHVQLSVALGQLKLLARFRSMFLGLSAASGRRLRALGGARGGRTRACRAVGSPIPSRPAWRILF
jgi:hypothetical protein